MADAVVKVVNNRPIVEVYGSHLLNPLVSLASGYADDAALAAGVAEAAAALVPGVFLSTATDTYIRLLIKSLTIEGGVAGRTYVLNYQTQEVGTGTLWRFKFYLLDPVLGVVVAKWEGEYTEDPVGLLPSQIPLTLAADGSTPYPDYQGVTATLIASWSVVELDHPLTTYTTTVEAGIRSENVKTDAELADFGDRPVLGLVVAPSGGTHTDPQTAVESLLDTGLANVFGRQTFPNTFRSTPSRPALIEVIGGTHEITPTAVDYGEEDPIDTGLILPQYSALRMRSATLFMDAAGSTAPVIEANWPCLIDGSGDSEIVQYRNGYGLHIDPGNVVWKRAVTGPAALWQRPRWTVRDLTLRHYGTSSASAMIGMGMPNGGILTLERVNFIREAGAAPLVIAHTSPNSTDPGLIILKDCRFNDQGISGGKAIQLLKSHDDSVLNRIVVINSELGTVEYVTGEGVAEDPPAWVRQGRFDGFTYSPDLDPA